VRVFRGVLIGVFDFHKAGDIGQEQVNQLRIKVCSPVFPDQFHRLFCQPGFFIGTCRSQSIEYVGQCCNSSGKRDALTSKSIWIATSVPFLMVTKRNFPGHYKKLAVVALLLHNLIPVNVRHVQI